MGKLVIFNFGNGNFEQGFSITLRIGEDGQPPYTEISGGLPCAPDIPQQYSRWQSAYCQLEGMAPRIEVPPAQVTNFSTKEECNSAAQALQNSLNRWLRQELFLDLRERLLEEVKRDDPVRFILQTQHLLLRRLPWHQCNLFQRYSKAEIALSSDYEPRPSNPLRSPVRILAILGSSEGIDVRADRALLEQLPGAQAILLEKPGRQQLNEQLWKQNWDILFFAGHSSSWDGGEQGQIQINDVENLSLKDLNYALGTAVNNGLKLAIFNSCDGLGLAQDLANLHIPQVIVMREPVPDLVAQEFLKNFLQAFARGESFYLAVRQAREQLQGMEGDFPCATWLPVICQNPAEAPITWPQICQNPAEAPITLPKKQHRALKAGLLLSGVVIAIFLGKHFFSPTPVTSPTSVANSVEKVSSSRFSLGGRILITKDSSPEKQAGAKAFAAKDFATAIVNFQSSHQVNPNDPETLIYLNNAKAASIGRTLRIAVSVPIGGNLGNAEEILRGVAQTQNEANQNGGINGSLLQVEIANDDNQPEIAAQNVAPKLVKDQQILAVVGHNASEVSIAAAPVYQQGGLVMISPTSSAMELSDIGSHIFRTVPSEQVDADNLAQYAIKKAGRTKFAICVDSQSPYSRSIETEFSNAVKQYGGQISHIFCDFSAPSFNPSIFVANAIADGVDGLLLAPSVEKIYQAIDVAKDSKEKLALFSCSPMYTYQTLKLGQGNVNGMVVAVIWHPAAIPRNSFANRASQLWGGSVSWRTAMSYDATQAIITALKQSTTRSGLQKVLSSPSFKALGATGDVQFLPSGGRQRSSELGVLVKVQPVANSEFHYGFVPMQP